MLQGFCWRRSLPAAQRSYAKLVRASFIISNSQYFSFFMVCWIVVAAIVIGVETYPRMDTKPSLIALNLVVAAFFTVELVLKVLSEGYAPWRYFAGPEWGWNIFNFLIVVACYSDFHVNVKEMRIIRFVRVFRVAKLVKEVPQLRVIMTGLVGCRLKVVYIMLLLALVYFIYAVFGMQLFQENDPFFFGCLHRALITLFKSSTMEDWHDVMYINMWGCDEWRHGIYVSPGSSGKDEIFWCSHSQGTLYASIYFVTFMVLAALVMMSLVIGGILLAMERTIMDMRDEMLEARRKHICEIRMQKAQAVAGLVDSPLINGGGDVDTVNVNPLQRLQHKETHDFITKEDRQNILLRNLMIRAWTGMEVNKLQEEQFYFDHSNKFVRIYARLSLKCGKLVKTKIFGNFILVTILAAGVTIGAETFENLSTSLQTIFYNLDTVFALIFTLEVTLKLIAEEFEPWKYFFNRWNVFDFIVVIGSLIAVTEENSRATGRIFMVLRLLRVLRVLKLITQLPFLQVVVEALIKSSTSIVSLGSIIFIFIYIFGVIGFTSFADNDPLNFRTLDLSIMCLFRVLTREDWSQPMFINAYGCDQLGYEEWPWMCVRPQRQYIVSVLFFLTFIVVGAVVLLALFIGVVITSMQEEDYLLRRIKQVQMRTLKIQEKYQLTNKCVQMYRDVFEFMDLDGGGSIALNELEMGLQAINICMTPQQLAEMFTEIDVDQNGEIDFSELLECMAILRFKKKPQKEQISELSVVRRFSKLKVNASNKLNNIKRKSMVTIEVLRKSSLEAIRRSSVESRQQYEIQGSPNLKQISWDHERRNHAPRIALAPLCPITECKDSLGIQYFTNARVHPTSVDNADVTNKPGKKTRQAPNNEFSKHSSRQRLIVPIKEISENSCAESKCNFFG